MHVRTRSRQRSIPRPSRGLAGVTLLAGLLTACVEPPPRGFHEFMEDRVAREGVLAHCERAARESLNEIECANARRAAVTLALREERARREELERESERKIKALRAQVERREREARAAQAAAARAVEQAYEPWTRAALEEIDLPAYPRLDAGP